MDYVAAAVVFGFVSNVLYQYGRCRRLDLIRGRGGPLSPGCCTCSCIICNKREPPAGFCQSGRLPGFKRSCGVAELGMQEPVSGSP